MLREPPGFSRSPLVEDPRVRFFVITSNLGENVVKSVEHNVWATQRKNEDALTDAFLHSKAVILIFSVNKSGAFQGYARMRGLPGRSKCRSNPFGGYGRMFDVEWLRLQDVVMPEVSYIRNSLDGGREVGYARDGQELPAAVGAELCRHFDVRVYLEDPKTYEPCVDDPQPVLPPPVRGADSTPRPGPPPAIPPPHQPAHELTGVKREQVHEQEQVKVKEEHAEQAGPIKEAKRRRLSQKSPDVSAPSFESRLTEWAEKCLAFQSSAKMWLPTKPCCPASPFLGLAAAPWQGCVRDKTNACVQLLGKEQFRELRDFYRENPHYALFHDSSDASSERQPETTAGSRPQAYRSSIGNQHRAAECMKMWPWMRDLPTRA
eukprot:s3112_g5.t1